MSSGILATSLPSPAVAVVPRFEPYLVEIIMPFPLGAADEAVAAAAQEVAALLSMPALGPATAETPDAEDDGPRVATSAMVQAVGRVIQAAAEQYAEAMLADLMTKPDLLVQRYGLATACPGIAGVPWLNGGLWSVAGDAD